MHIKVEQWTGLSPSFIDDEVVEGIMLPESDSILCPREINNLLTCGMIKSS